MFRRSKDDQNPPKPQTFAQMVEDLDTFEVERVPVVVRTLKADAISVETGDNNNEDIRDANLAQWWDAFETFQTDVQEMHKLRREIITGTEEVGPCKRKNCQEISTGNRKRTKFSSKEINGFYLNMF